MGLAKDLDDHQRSLPAIAQLLSSLPTNDREALRRALTDQADGEFRWSAGQLAARLREDGHAVNKQQVIRWRRRHVAE